MRLPILTVALAALLLATDALAQRRIRPDNRGRRPEEISNRVGVYFADTLAPAVDGDKVADLATCELVRAATASKELTVLYLVDLEDDARKRNQFERQLFSNDEIGIELRTFHCGRIDLSKAKALAERYDKKTPLFAVFDAKGKMIEVPMTDYRASRASLTLALEKAANGAMKPALPTFAKRYGRFVTDLEKVLNKKEKLDKERIEAKNEGERKKIDKELEKLGKEEEKLLETEKKLLDPIRLPKRPANARRLGGRDRKGRGGRGGGGAAGGGAAGGAAGGGGSGTD